MNEALKPLLESKGIKIAHLARDLGVNKSTVSRWKRVPAERADAVATITGIPKSRLRPDLWSEAAQ